MPSRLRLLSGGAAKGLVQALEPAFAAVTGGELQAEFSAVGTMREALLAGQPCDLVILTAALVDALARDGHVVAGSIAALGRVFTGVAVRVGASPPAVADVDTLRRTLETATGIFIPDTRRATAGIHVVGMLRDLGLERSAAPRIREFANGALAMGALARADGAADVGITQASEIIATPGIALVGMLPARFELATVYAVAVAARAREPALARQFAQLLTAPESGDARRRSGFQE